VVLTERERIIRTPLLGVELQTGSHGMQDRQTVMICHFRSSCSVLLEWGHDPVMHVVAAAQRTHPVVVPMLWQIREEPYTRSQAHVLNNKSSCWSARAASSWVLIRVPSTPIVN
jgi:hypothetical protein